MDLDAPAERHDRLLARVVDVRDHAAVQVLDLEVRKSRFFSDGVGILPIFGLTTRDQRREIPNDGSGRRSSGRIGGCCRLQSDGGKLFATSLERVEQSLELVRLEVCERPPPALTLVEIS